MLLPFVSIVLSLLATVSCTVTPEDCERVNDRFSKVAHNLGNFFKIQDGK